jgi:hypothetical protein
MPKHKLDKLLLYYHFEYDIPKYLVTFITFTGFVLKLLIANGFF